MRKKGGEEAAEEGRRGGGGRRVHAPAAGCNIPKFPKHFTLCKFLSFQKLFVKVPSYVTIVGFSIGFQVGMIKTVWSLSLKRAFRFKFRI
jgi:hypothetical protein